MSNISKGALAEELAQNHYMNNGATIISTNFVCYENKPKKKIAELDIIALKDSVLHFIEVKYRSTSKFGKAIEQISRKKLENIIKGVNCFLLEYPYYNNMKRQIDLVVIDGNNLQVIENAVLL